MYTGTNIALVSLKVFSVVGAHCMSLIKVDFVTAFLTELRDANVLSARRPKTASPTNNDQDGRTLDVSALYYVCRPKMQMPALQTFILACVHFNPWHIVYAKPMRY